MSTTTVTPARDRGRAGPAVDQHHPHPLDRRGRARQVGPPRHADGAGAARLHDLEPRHAVRSRGPDLAQPRPLRPLQRPRLDAAVVRSPPHRDAGGERRLRAARRAVGDARRHPALPPDREQGARPPRVSLGLGRRDDHGAPRPGRRDERGDGDRAQVARRALQPAGLPDLRLRHLRRGRRRLPDGGRGAARRRRSPATSASTTSAGSTTTTTSRSRAPRASPSPRTWPRASSPMAGTSCAWATPTTPSASSRPSPSSARRRGDPRSSCSTATSATALPTSTTRPPPMASRSARTRAASPSAATGGRRTRSSWSPTACAITSRPGSERAALPHGKRGRSCSRPTGRPIPSWPRRSTRCSGGSCRRAGTRTCRSSRRTRRAWRAGMPRARC